MFDKHVVDRAASLAFAKTGNKIAASIAIIAITTSSSIRVNPLLFWNFDKSYKQFILLFYHPFNKFCDYNIISACLNNNSSYHMNLHVLSTVNVRIEHS